MEKIIGKGMLGQSGVAVIAIMLVLQVVLPYVGSDKTGSNLTASELFAAVEPFRDGLRELKSLNDNQAAADTENVNAHRRLTEALILMAASVERMADAVDRIDRNVEGLSP